MCLCGLLPARCVALTPPTPSTAKRNQTDAHSTPLSTHTPTGERQFRAEQAADVPAGEVCPGQSLLARYCTWEWLLVCVHGGEQACVFELHCTRQQQQARSPHRHEPDAWKFTACGIMAGALCAGILPKSVPLLQRRVPFFVLGVGGIFGALTHPHTHPHTHPCTLSCAPFVHACTCDPP